MDNIINMTAEQIKTIKQEIGELKEQFDDFKDSIDEFHDKVSLKNKEQDTSMVDMYKSMQSMQNSVDKLYDGLKWLATTGKIIKYTAGLLAAIGVIITILGGYLKTFIIANLKF